MELIDSNDLDLSEFPKAIDSIESAPTTLLPSSMWEIRWIMNGRTVNMHLMKELEHMPNPE